MSEVGAGLTRARGAYPERGVDEERGLDRLVRDLLGQLKRLRGGRVARHRRIVELVEAHGSRFAGLSDEELGWQARSLRPELRAGGLTPARVAESFALVREVAGRRLEMRHFDVQLIGGWVLLNGMVAEMATGEGKTLTATLPACTLALAGVPVHVITVNDYLARRDAAWMAPVYEALGLSVGVVAQGMDLEQRRQAYRCDVTYCTNKELVFDYLRDRLDLGRRPGPIRSRLERLGGKAGRVERLRLRGLYFAIVDEADSVLIDEARTPLIISGPGDNSFEAEVYRQALELSEGLESGRDYYVDFANRTVELREAAGERLETLAEPLHGFWTGKRRREELVRLALTARHLFHRDKHYVVRDGKVQIVDEYTGRIMPDRSWEYGLHQLIETKEQCDVTTQTEVLGRISYQKFFRRYLALSGMTGTAREAAGELWSVYRLEVAAVPTNKPMRLRGLRTRIFRTADEKWAAIVARIGELHDRGRPVLVGTRTVAASEHLAELLAAAGLESRVLNALQDRHEAEIVAAAGRRGQITVATNMAGRGTDIKLESGIAELGGLHVIATELHDAGRIDRQLFGRCGRQGDPGSFEAFASLQDELLRAYPRRVLGLLPRRWVGTGNPAGRLLARLLFRRAQRAAERSHFAMRRDLLKLDDSLERALAFAGRGE